MSDTSMNTFSGRRSKEIAHALCVAFGVLVLSLAMSIVDARESAIKFKKGETSATIESSWRGENEVFTFRAKKGQRISLRLDDGRKASTNLRMTLYKYCGEEYGIPMADDVASFDGVLPCTDQYSFDIQPRSNATMKVDEIGYTLVISIK
jgi:hypothetical protein